MGLVLASRPTLVQRRQRGRTRVIPVVQEGSPRPAGVLLGRCAVNELWGGGFRERERVAPSTSTSAVLTRFMEGLPSWECCCEESGVVGDRMVNKRGRVERLCSILYNDLAGGVTQADCDFGVGKGFRSYCGSGRTTDCEECQGLVSTSMRPSSNTPHTIKCTTISSKSFQSRSSRPDSL